MLPRLSPLLRATLPADAMAARVLSRAVCTSSLLDAYGSRSYSTPCPVSVRSQVSFSRSYSSVFGWRFRTFRCRNEVVSGEYPKVFASQRAYRKVQRRRRRPAKSKEKELELNVKICIEEQLPDDPEILNIAEMLRLNVPMAMKLAFDGIKDSVYKTRDPAVNDVGCFEAVELSVLLCNDDFICKLNKEWRDEDHATDVLSMSQHIPELKLPILMLGDIVISVETAARQAEERGHTLLDEIRILLVHGLLHLLGFDHEISDEAETEMEKEEEFLLKSLGWKGKGLIQSAYDAETNEGLLMDKPDGRESYK